MKTDFSTVILGINVDLMNGVEFRSIKVDKLEKKIVLESFGILLQTVKLL